jgi:hypothetical protein
VAIDDHLLNTVPERFRVATDQAAVEMSAEARFLDETTIQDPEGVITNDELGNRYQGWCDREHIPTIHRLSNDQLGRAMNGLGWESARRQHGGKVQRLRAGRRWR